MATLTQWSEDLAHLIAGPHHLAERLDDQWRNQAHTKLIGQHVKQAIETPGSRTAVITPPQIGKSSLCAIWVPFWLLMCDPKTLITVTSYGQHLANRNGRAIRNLVRDYGHRFGRELASDARSVSEWYTSKGGGVKSAGIGAGITGFASNFMIIDDIYKNRADAESPLVRETIWEWLSSSSITRLSPEAPVFMIGTLWTEQDPILRLIKREGRIEDGGKWRIIHLPAIADLTLTQGTDPLGRADGEPLTHPMIPDTDRDALLRHWKDKQSSVLPRDWISLYQGDPHPREGALVSWDIVHAATVPREQLPQMTRVVVSVDPSGGGQDEVGIVTAGLGTDGVCYIMNDHASGVMPVTQWPAKVCAEAKQYDADRIVMEANYGGRMVEQSIRSAWDAGGHEGLMPPVTTVRALKGKALRAEPVAQEMAQGRVKMVAGLTKLQGQWTSYRPGATDSPGRLDAAVYATVELLPGMPGTDHLMTLERNRRIDQVQPKGRRLPGK